MEIWPAIDLRGGRCVRLEQGDFGRETIFGDDPAEMARRWVDEGATRLHLVDLDGARSGERTNREAVAAILKAVNVPCQLGGGIRDEATIRELLDLGVARLVIGTQAIKDPAWCRQMLRRYPEQLALGIDARDGQVATEGWLDVSQVPATKLAQAFADEPLAAIIYTDIRRDGMLAGPNFSALRDMQEAVDVPIIASGGVTTAEDIQHLAQQGLAGCIIGRALYEGKLILSNALSVAADFPH